ncbi:hypothetical protein KL930_001653 [Ogataea haglerorum]|nr:hypothetical protein KL915_001708 [Ogataea haglerorum]KAG7710759.1 hypothetical protein KL950_001672 [Ogataea haglerorum]KAG7744597.1 hypothetical protein KL932_001113 [Ogataea haglerorum]KAG7775937.1 hypothetical protein KL922_004002 [Ogataea haglerorum]KAG7780731.1 hypothetical protein KL930_001653 [Ogataea haglerorum]
MSDGNLITKMLADAAAEAEKEKQQRQEVNEVPARADEDVSPKDARQRSTKQHVYSPEFLLSLKGSPLCADVSHLNLPSNQHEFFLLDQPKRTAYANHNNHKYPNQRGRKDRKKDTRKTAKETEEPPEWVLKSDAITGNSIQDFELWRLKMRIETFRRNGEPVPMEDVNQYEYLKAQKAESAVAADQSSQSVPKPVTRPEFDFHEPIQEPGSNPDTFATSSSGSSRFSSFFGPEQTNKEPQRSPTKDESKLLSLLQNSGKQVPQAQPIPQAMPQVAMPPGLAPTAAVGPLGIVGHMGPTGPLPPVGAMPVMGHPPSSNADMFFNSLLSKAPAPGSAPFLPPGLFLPFSEKK